MGLKVKGPDVNESEVNFTVNKAGEIRFGMGGIKGVGQGAVEAIVNEREKNGNYTDIFDFVERVNLNACNRKTIESLAYAGAFDCFTQVIREQYFASNVRGEVTLDVLMRYGQRYQQDKAANSNTLFGGFDAIEIPKPEIPKCEPWSTLERLKREKDLIGIHLSAHPLDQYRVAIQYGCSAQLADMESIKNGEDCTFTVAGMVTASRSGISRNGNPYGMLTVEDYSGSFEFPLWGKDYTTYAGFMKENIFLAIRGKVQERGADRRYQREKKPGEPRQPELKITSIELLGDVADKMVTRLTLMFDLERITSEVNQDLFSLLSDNQGSSELHVVLHDPSSSTCLSTRSRKVHVNITDKVVDALTDMQSQGWLTFKVN